MIDFVEFLEAVIDKQGDSRDMYDEILKGFAMFDYGKKILVYITIKIILSCRQKNQISVFTTTVPREKEDFRNGG